MHKRLWWLAIATESSKSLEALASWSGAEVLSVETARDAGALYAAWRNGQCRDVLPDTTRMLAFREQAERNLNRLRERLSTLKRAKKTYKKSKSQSQSQSSQSGGRKRRSKGVKGVKGVKTGGNSAAQDMFQEPQNGGSGMAGKPAFGSTAQSL